MATVREYGIDVSYYQGVIDWSKVKAAGVNYVVLRAGYGFRTVDTQFASNIAGAISAGIENIGIYWFSYASSTDDIQTELSSCLATIEPYRENINLPVWFDWEEASNNYVKNTYGLTLTNAQIQALATAWVNGARSAGYESGIYSNKSNAAGWFKRSDGLYLWEYLKCQFWYARYGANNEKDLFIIPEFEETALNEHPETDVFQYSDVGQIDGINSQRVDLNVFYIDEDEPPTPPTPPTPTPVTATTETARGSIDYVEVRDTDFGVIGICDTAKSIIWNSVYYGVGDFEVYVEATPENINMFAVGNYVTRPDNAEVGIIEKIQIEDDTFNGLMLAATGRFAKSILDRRVIYNLSGTVNTATILRGNVETNIRALVKDNAINCSFDSTRNFSQLELGAVAKLTPVIIDENGNAAQKQVSYSNLLEYTDGVLEEYGLSATVVLDKENGKLQYICFEGQNRTTANESGEQPIIFSKEFDNLSASVYEYNAADEKNTALIGGEGEGLDRFYALLSANKSDLKRREMFVDASSINKKYKDENNEEKTYTDAEYTELLNAKGKQDLAPLTAVESFSGTIDITNGNYIFGRDFSLGDIVTIQDNEIGKYINVRIQKITEVQDENGYTVEAEYSST